MTAKPPPIAGLYLNCPLGGSSDLLLRRFRRPLALLLLAFFHNRLVCRVDGGFASIQFLDKPLGRLVALLSGLPNPLGRFVSAAGAKTNGGGDFVAGSAFIAWGNISRSVLAGRSLPVRLSPPRPLPLNGFQLLGLSHLLREGLLPLPVKLNDCLSLVKVVSIADHLHRDVLHLQRQSRLPTSVAADDGAVLLDGERLHDPMPSHALNEIRRRSLVPVDLPVQRVRL